MSNTQQIIEYLDRWMITNHTKELSAVQAAEILDKAGLLKDSSTRPGKPLRDKLRKKELPHAYQNGVHWFIPCSKKSTASLLNASKTVSVSPKESSYKLSQKLLDKNNFLYANTLSIDDIPNIPGIYAIRIKSPDILPPEFSQELKRRGETLLYIGQASKSLQKRLWEEELHAQRPATFFRSIGAILGYYPPKGSLRGMRNQSNYKFSSTDNIKIIKWIQDNLLVNFVECTSNSLDAIEKSIIKETTPIVNIQNNPHPFELLIRLREKCKETARS